MSVEVCYELQDSMSGSVTNEMESGETLEVKRRYLIGRCFGFNDCVTQISLYAPPYVLSDGAGIFWVRKRLDVAGVGNRYFDCTATYQTLVPKFDNNDSGGGGGGGGGGIEKPQPGGIAWDTTGHTERIYQALEETKYPEDPETPTMEGAINVSGNAVEGIDVVRPSMRYSETWILPASIALSDAFVGAVHKLTGTVNNAKFRVFEPGESLFMGGRCQWQGDQPYAPVTFEFECRPNQMAPNAEWYTPGIGYTIPKEGWEYIWIKYEDAVSGSTLIRRPKYVYKNKVFEKKNWFAEGLLIADPAKKVGRARAGVQGQQAPAGGGNIA
jgi:hypothetical protein